MFGGFADGWAAMSVLDATTKIRLTPLELRKAGVVINNMQSKDYNEEDINHVCRALFLQRPEDLSDAWGVFSHKRNNNGGIEAKSMMEVLPMLGEDVNPSEIEV